MTAGALIHRAIVERNTQAGTDGFGKADKPTWQEQADPVACHFFSKVRTEVVDEDVTVQVEEIRGKISLAASASLVEGTDRIKEVQNKRGQVIIAGPLKIIAIVRKRTHYAVQLERFK